MDARPRSASLVRAVTLLGAVALVVGNMVGTSIYTLPATLARDVGPLAIASWIATAAGYLFVALVYASLGARYPAVGGPYVFAREAFGPFAGFQTAWTYWCSATIGNAGIVTSVVAYATGFSARLAESVPLQFALAQALLWGLCALNVLGVRQSARLQIAIVFVNLAALLVVSAAALAKLDARNFEPLAPRGYGSIAAGVALVIWAYSGVESATVPAEEVQRPEHTIGRATLAGYAIATLAFVLVAVAVAGALPNAEIASSARPIALVAERALGTAGAAVVGVAAIAAGLGTLNGWVLMVGRIPVGAARDGVFFRALARVHPRFGTPHVALVAGTAVSSAMLLLYFRKSLLGVFQTIVLLSVLTTLVPHLFAAAAELVLSRRGAYTPRERHRAMIVAPLAFAFLAYAVYGVGAEIAAMGAALMLAGVPLYAFFRRR